MRDSFDYELRDSFDYELRAFIQDAITRIAGKEYALHNITRDHTSICIYIYILYL